MTAKIIKFPERRPNKYKASLLYSQASSIDSDASMIEEAISLYEQAIRIDPFFADAMINLGNMFHAKGNRTQALKMFKRAVDIVPDHVEGNYNIGVVSISMETYTDAITHLTKAVSFDPSFSDAYFNLAIAYERSNKLRKARENYELYVKYVSEMGPNESKKEQSWITTARRKIEKITMTLSK